MSLCKTCGLAIVAAVSLLGETTDLAHAQCLPGESCALEWVGGSVINLGGLPGSVGGGALASTTPGKR
jgi:hypothetical protein